MRWMRWMRFSLNVYYCLLAINTCPNNKTVSHSTCSTNAAESSSIKPAEWRQSNIKIGLAECRVQLETHRKTWQKTAIKTINFVSVYYISSAAINSALCFSLLWKAWLPLYWLAGWLLLLKYTQTHTWYASLTSIFSLQLSCRNVMTIEQIDRKK